MPRVNTTMPDSYGLSLTVYVPTASEANPIETGDILSWSTTSGYSAVPAGAGDAIQLRAKHPVTDPLEPLGVHAFGFSRVERLPFEGTAPALGDSVTADGKGGVTTAGDANGSRVLYVDVAAGLVDVALP
ncbi:hypothetical protein F7731_23585 [Cytobacillus depressus]|uniref:DUF2190 family protein n=1 Tax=Cytobacillus depressus TaxID=1602942 RepID=A0A6L3V3B2_9BACI|nr:hypothetical protein [Cytobacillus depressus]KAB2328938.1 hypothetical protein F7731_23585 [Cytobacillus depressus]